MNLGRRDLLKIGGGILGFAGGASGAITLMQQPATAVEAQFQLSGPDSKVKTADGELNSLTITLSEYTIQYQNLTIIDRKNASLKFGISVDVFVGSKMVLSGPIFDGVKVPIKNHDDFHNLLNQDAIKNSYSLLEKLSKTQNVDGSRTFDIPDGQTETVRVSVRPYITANGLSEQSAKEIQSEGKELSKSVSFNLKNQDTTAQANIDGTVDAS